MDAQNYISPIDVRPGSESDVASIVAIIEETLLDHIAASGGDVGLLSESFVKATLEYTKVLVAECDKGVIGYLQYQIAGPRLVVNGAAITGGYQGQGIGTGLLRLAVDDAHEQGCEWVVISVQPTNVDVWTMYRRLGFREVEDSPQWNRTLVQELSPVRALLATLRR